MVARVAAIKVSSVSNQAQRLYVFQQAVQHLKQQWNVSANRDGGQSKIVFDLKASEPIEKPTTNQSEDVKEQTVSKEEVEIVLNQRQSIGVGSELAQEENNQRDSFQVQTDHNGIDIALSPHQPWGTQPDLISIANTPQKKIVSEPVVIPLIQQMQTNKMSIYPHEPVKKVRVRSFAEFIESGEYSEDSEEESKSNAISKIHKPESNTSSMIDLGLIKQKQQQEDIRISSSIQMQQEPYRSYENKANLYECRTPYYSSVYKENKKPNYYSQQDTFQDAMLELASLQIDENQKQNDLIKQMQSQEVFRKVLQELPLIPKHCQPITKDNLAKLESKKPKLEGLPYMEAVYREFKECDSVYEISIKSDDSEISSDGEFNEVCRLQFFQEDDSRINEVEKQRERKKVILYHDKNRPYVPILEQLGHTPKFKPYQEYSPEHTPTCGEWLEYYRAQGIEKNEIKEEGTQRKTKRYKGMEYFTTVAYTQRNHKPIPRWVSDLELLDSVVVHQRKTDCAENIFGLMDPRKAQFNLREIFQGMIYLVHGTKKQKKFDKRGSSALWNDQLEFATPIPTKKVQQIEKEGNSSRNELGTSSKKEEKFVSQFNPFGVQDNSKMPANEYFHKLHLKVQSQQQQRGLINAFNTSTQSNMNEIHNNHSFGIVEENSEHSSMDLQ